MRSLLLAKSEVFIWRSKGLEKSVKAKKRAEHNNYSSFSKVCYCAVPHIYGCCLGKNLEIS